MVVSNDGNYIYTLSSTTSYGNGDSDNLLAIFDKDGTLTFSATAGSPDEEIPTSLSLTSDNSFLYLLGYYRSPFLVYDTTPPIDTVEQQDRDIFVLKLRISTGFSAPLWTEWAGKFGSGRIESALESTVSPQLDNSLYLTGRRKLGEGPTAPNYFALLILGISDTGQTLFKKQLGGVDYIDSGNDITISADGKIIYVIGQLQSTGYTDSGANRDSVTFIRCYTKDGTCDIKKKFNEYLEIGYGIAIDSEGYIILGFIS